jgi:hypothetical protein
MIRQVWAGGVPSPDDQSMLDVVRLSLGITADEHRGIEREVQLEIYAEVLGAAWKSGEMTQSDTQAHEQLRKLFNVKMDDHKRIVSRLKAEK